jgi:hypothetical protein
METPLETAIRRRLNWLVTGQLSIRDFADWFIPATWDVESCGDESLGRLSFSVLHRLNEWSLSVLDDHDLVDLLRPYAEPPSLAYGSSAPNRSLTINEPGQPRPRYALAQTGARFLPVSVHI